MTEAKFGRIQRLIGMEMIKLRSRRATWTLLSIYAGLTFLMPWLFYLVTQLGSTGTNAAEKLNTDFVQRVSYPGALQGALDALISFGLPLLMILSAAAFGGEFAWGTLRLLVIRGEGRREFVLTKLAALFLAWVIATGIGLLIALTSVTIVSFVGNYPGPSHITGADLLVFLGHLAAAILAGWVYIALTSLATLRYQSTAFGIAIGFFIFYADWIASESAIATALRPLELLGRSSLNYNLRTLTGGAADSANPVPLALFAVVAFLAASIIASLRQLDRRDITISGVG